MDEDTRVTDSENVEVTDADIDALKAEDGNIDVAKLKEALADRKKLASTNPKLFQRAKNAEEKLKNFKPETITKTEPSDEVLKDISELKLAEQKRQFGYENNLSPDQTDKVFQLTNNKPTKEILEDDFVKAGLQALKSKQRVENNIPSPNRVVTVKGKSFSELSRDDKISNFGDYMKKSINKE